MAFDDVRARIAAALALGEHDRLEPAADLTCRHLPTWVGEYGAARFGGVWLLYLARAAGTQPDAMEQAVLEVPAGRYLVERTTSRAQLAGT